MLAEIFEREPALGEELDNARGICERFMGLHPDGRKCKKGVKCPYLHVHPGQDLASAPNRLRSPFLHLTADNKLLVMPPLKKAREILVDLPTAAKNEDP